MLIVDDLVDQENSRPENQLQKLRLWLAMTLQSTLKPEGEVHFLGTRYHAEDLYGELANGEFIECFLVDKAFSDSGESLWPSKFPASLLQSKCQEMGSVAFGMQYQNDVSGSKGDIFQFDWIKYYDVAPSQFRVFQGVDLAIGQKSSHDYFAHCTVGSDANFTVFVLEYYRGRHSFLEQADILVRKFQQFDPIRVGIEIVAYQSALAHHLRAQTQVRVHELPAKVDKVTRAQALSAKFESRQVHFLKFQQDLIEEVCEFPNAQHDDLFDALEFAIRLGTQIAIRKRRAIEPGLIGISSVSTRPDLIIRKFMGLLKWRRHH
jgi:predicted phage terminase large subunit-like protein